MLRKLILTIAKAISASIQRILNLDLALSEELNTHSKWTQKIESNNVSCKVTEQSLYLSYFYAIVERGIPRFTIKK